MESSVPSEIEAQVELDILPLHSPNLLTVLDEDGIIHYESPSIERIYGFDQEELVGDQVAEYFHPDDRAEVLEAFRAVVTGEESTVQSIEYRHEQADGTYTWVESIASADPTPNGYYVINTRDLSTQKARERELQATNERLEEFASIVSHDLRNPLNIAQGHLELLDEVVESEHIEAISRAHEQMNTLIADLLTLSRVGNQVSTREAVDLASLVEACWRTVPTEQATFVVDTDQQLLADHGRLRQVLENLMRNAVEHGGSDVTVTIGDLDTGFYVEDDGSGIPAPARDDIFATGYSTAEDGTGIGLSIVKQVVDAHDWEIDVGDGSEGGTRFEITGLEFVDG